MAASIVAMMVVQLFKQPETRTVGDWRARPPAKVRPVLMLDFHSTNRNLFNVQRDEASAQGKAFLAAWLGDNKSAFEGYQFKIEPRNANPGSSSSCTACFATAAAIAKNGAV